MDTCLLLTDYIDMNLRTLSIGSQNFRLIIDLGRDEHSQNIVMSQTQVRSSHVLVNRIASTILLLIVVTLADDDAYSKLLPKIRKAFE